MGQIVELMATLSAAGLPTIYQSINGAATTSAVTTVHPLPPAWSGSILYLNSAAGSLSGAAAFLNVLIVRGVQDIITMRRLADVP